jgi:hypothetical protein
MKKNDSCAVRVEWLLAVCALCGGVGSAAQAAENPKFDGVWQISVPQSELKPVSGAIPFTAEGRKRYEQNKRAKTRRDYSYDLTQLRCASPGLPRLMLTPKRFRIWQRPDHVTFVFEWNRVIRQIDLRGIQTEAPLVPMATGVSKGQWEGDTLVVRTDHLSDNTLIDALVPHTTGLKLTERIRLNTADTLEDRITIDDPASFSRPWETVLTYKRQPSAVFPEDVCLDRLEAGDPALPTK